MTQESPKAQKQELSAEQVAAYLLRHPDFLQNHPDVINALTPPGRSLGDGVTDLQSAMIEKLRQESDRQAVRQRELMTTSRVNLSTQTRVHECVLYLLAANSFEQLIQTVTTDFAVLLNLDIVTLSIESDPDSNVVALHQSGLQTVPHGTVDAILGETKNTALHSDIDGDPEIFGNGASLVRSAAFIRLKISSATPPAMIAFGTRKAGKFHAGQGTELLTFLGHVLEHVIRQWLELPE